MTLMECIRQRYALRQYSDTPVDREDLLYCAEAARLAPSAFNLQPWKFIIVDDPELRSKVAAAVANPILKSNVFIKQAPALVVVVRDTSTGLSNRLKSMVTRSNLSSFDIGCAVENFCLAACDRGLGSCVVGWFKANRIKELLFIPDDREVALVIGVGYPHPDVTPPEDKDRKALMQVCSFNSFDQ